MDFEWVRKVLTFNIFSFGREPKLDIGYPAPENVEGWDDATLASALWLRTTELYDALGIKGLSESEKTLLTSMTLDNEVNNGGFAQYLYQTPSDILAVTVACLQRLGVQRMVDLVTAVFQTSGGDLLFDERRREEILDSLPTSHFNELENRGSAFIELESEFLDAVYRYARENWSQIRPARE